MPARDVDGVPDGTPGGAPGGAGAGAVEGGTARSAARSGARGVNPAPGKGAVCQQSNPSATGWLPPRVPLSRSPHVPDAVTDRITVSARARELLADALREDGRARFVRVRVGRG